MRLVSRIGFLSHHFGLNAIHIGVISNLKRHNIGICCNGIHFPIVYQRRYYRPDWMVDWVRIKQRWRTQQIINKKKKHKTHSRIDLIRFGWERPAAKRHGIKYNMSDKKYRSTMKIKYVHRNDIKKMVKQMPGYTLRLRDPPINNNPNIQRSRNKLGSYFG